MNDLPQSHAQSAPVSTNHDDSSLFMWRGSDILLIGVRENGRWILARAWLAGDRLEHVRRWSFAQPIPFSRQVRRLVLEAMDDLSLARDEGFRALAWAEAIS